MNTLYVLQPAAINRRSGNELLFRFVGFLDGAEAPRNARPLHRATDKIACGTPLSLYMYFRGTTGSAPFARRHQHCSVIKLHGAVSKVC